MAVNPYLEQGANPAFLDPNVQLDASQRACLLKAVGAFYVDRKGKLNLVERQALIAALRRRMAIPSQP
jgi:hypothetical protein